MKTLLKTFLIISAFLSASSAYAQMLDISTIDQSEVLPYLNAQIIEPALKTVTGNHVVTIDKEEQAYIVATAANGLSFEIHFKGCDGEKPIKCKAMSLMSIWEKSSKSKTKKINKKIPSFLIDNPLVNAGVLEDGTPYVVRYVIADFGAPQGNIVSEISNFIQVSTNFSAYLKK